MEGEAAPPLGLPHVLLLASLREHTGNCVTAHRLAAALAPATSTCADIGSFEDVQALERRVREERVGLVVGIHAYRSGRLMVGLSVPYVIVLGGTDVNIHVHQPEKRLIMEQALNEARAIVAFTQDMLDALIRASPTVSAKAHLVPQAIVVAVPARSLDGSAIEDIDLAEEERNVLDELDVRHGERLLLLPAGLRPVKDVLFAAQAVAEWRKDGGAVVLRIVGPELDAEYSADVQKAIRTLDPPRAVAWCGALSQRKLHLAMRAALAVLNTSVSEGMCNSILEAFAIGTPVLARHNIGNATLVKHGATGMLAESPHDLVAQARLLLEDAAVCNKLGSAAQEMVAREHSPEHEAKQYSRILTSVLASRPN
eukprot:scaffold154321_cov33-Tisochrysis_lutea.AAC.4